MRSSEQSRMSIAQSAIQQIVPTGLRRSPLPQTRRRSPRHLITLWRRGSRSRPNDLFPSSLTHRRHGSIEHSTAAQGHHTAGYLAGHSNRSE